MVGNSSWNFEGRDFGDTGRRVTKVFAWFPTKTNKGHKWLCYINRVSTIEKTWSKFWHAIGLGGSSNIEVIRYEEIE